LENFRLKVFRAVAMHLNFRRAAEDLLLTQPAVTLQIKTLEDELQVPLFDRSGGRVTLTPSGKLLYDYAVRLAALAEEATQAISMANGSAAGKLLLGASQTIAQYVLPRMLGTFQRENPRLQLALISGNTEEMLEALMQHRIALALIEGPSLRRDVKTVPFIEDEMVLVLPPHHVWATQSIDVQQLKEAPLLMRETGSGSRRVVEQALAQTGLRSRDLRIAMTLDSTEGLISGVEAGLGFTFVSRWAVRNQLALGTLATATLRGLRITRLLSVAYAAGPEPSGSAGLFLRFVTGRAAEILTSSISGQKRSEQKRSEQTRNGKKPSTPRRKSRH
jgi:DNA-binding transcriptional LysR family regulator